MSSLNPRFVLGDLDLTEYPFGTAFGSSLGNPEQVVDVLASLLADGEVESRSRRTNRTLTIPLLIEGQDLAQLAQAEADLVAECDKQRNMLTVDPGDGYGPPTVFDTFGAHPEREYDDDAEQANLRRWTLTVRALPHGRSVDLVIDDAGTPPSSGTVVEPCDSATGWSKWSTWAGGGGSGTTITTDSAIKVEGAASVRANAQYGNINADDSFYWGSSDQRDGLSIDTGVGGGYLSIVIRTTVADASSDGLRQLWMTTAAGEIQVSNFIAVDRDSQGFVRYVWPVAAGLTVTKLRFYVTQTRAAGNGSITAQVWYDDVELLPSATTDHQIVKQHTVLGSARTVGSLRIASPSEVVGLDKVLAITVPTGEILPGFQPDGGRWVSQGTTTPDATAMGGAYYSPDAAAYSTAAGKPIFDVPVNMLTAGPYTMVALVKAESSSLTFGVQARLRIGTTDVGPTSAAEVSPKGLTTGWQFVTVGTVYLPPLPMQSADETAKVRLLFKGAKMVDVYMIPAWQVGGRPVADFSIVDCGTGTVAAGGASSSLWIDSPSVSQPQGGWWRGPTADRAMAQSAWPDAKKPGVHAFPPGPLTNFVVSTGAQGPTSTLEYFPAWLGSAAL